MENTTDKPLLSLAPGSRLLLMRHGRTEYNRLGIRCGGDVDIPLDEVGRSQAMATGAQIRAAGIAVHWMTTGTLIRLRQSAEIVAEALGIREVAHDPRLNERRLGDWNGQAITETEAALRAGVAPPGGESSDEFRERVLGWFREFQWRVGDNPGLMVVSKGVCRILGEALTGRNHPLDNGRLLAIEADETGRCVVSELLETTPIHIPSLTNQTASAASINPGDVHAAH